jgi:hypothetical protein
MAESGAPSEAAGKLWPVVLSCIFRCQMTCLSSKQLSEKVGARDRPITQRSSEVNIGSSHEGNWIVPRNSDIKVDKPTDDEKAGIPSSHSRSNWRFFGCLPDRSGSPIWRKMSTEGIWRRHVSSPNTSPRNGDQRERTQAEDVHDEEIPFRWGKFEVNSGALALWPDGSGCQELIWLENTGHCNGSKESLVCFGAHSV